MACAFRCSGKFVMGVMTNMMSVKTKTIRLLSLVLACMAGALPCVSQTRRTKAVNGDELLATADTRIEKIRKADANIKITDRHGRPVRGAKARVEQMRHRFLFGAHVLPLYQYKPEELFTPAQKITPPLVTGERKRIFEESFKELFNFATLGFQWSFYEPRANEKNTANTDRVAAWCKENDIAMKGHVLVWHQHYPKWLPTNQIAARSAIKTHITDAVARYKNRIDYWDVVNEQAELMSPNPRRDRFDNPITQWVKQESTAQVVGQCLQWAHTANPQAKLLYNDFMLNPDFERIVSDLSASRRPLDAVGIQSHMYGADWTIEKTWQACETYGQYGVPVHFTEVSVLSGDHDRSDEAQSQPTALRPSTPEGEQRQADYVEKFYTLLFSHPKVEAISWWDFKDGGITFKLRPAGLLREDLTPKPAYERLRSLIKGKWWTRADVTTDRRGAAKVRGFMGRYRVTVETPAGTRTQKFELQPGVNRWTIKL